METTITHCVLSATYHCHATCEDHIWHIFGQVRSADIQFCGCFIKKQNSCKSHVSIWPFVSQLGHQMFAQKKRKPWLRNLALDVCDTWLTVLWLRSHTVPGLAGRIVTPDPRYARPTFVSCQNWPKIHTATSIARKKDFVSLFAAFNFLLVSFETFSPTALQMKRVISVSFLQYYYFVLPPINKLQRENQTDFSRSLW